LILLLGGTRETRPIAEALARTGGKVLVSTATDNELDIGAHPNISRRAGRLGEEGIVSLIREKGVRVIVDATHPFAVIVHETARNSAQMTGVPYLRFERPAMEYGDGSVIYAENHDEAAITAFSFGKPVLLTTGSRHLLPYTVQSRATGVPVAARVLAHPESVEACKRAGLADSQVIFGRGPFSVDENLDVIKRFNIGTIVTKDSGASGGVPEKVESARIAGCRIVIVKRPGTISPLSFGTVEALVAEVLRRN